MKFVAFAAFLMAMAAPSFASGRDHEAAPSFASARDHEEWLPGPGRTTELTRTVVRFDRLMYLHPLRLHLSLGGHVEGTFGGLDGGTGEILLVLPTSQFRVDLRLIDAVTPLTAPMGPKGEVKDILDRKHVEVKLVPTKLSHAGLALSLLAPGVGQFIQKKDQEIGFLFMGLELFMAAGAILAGVVAPGLEPQDRIPITAGFAGVGVAIAITAGVHAFRTGREYREVEVEEVRSRRRPSP